jgi:outer membrane protein assembly factor BamB
MLDIKRTRPMRFVALAILLLAVIFSGCCSLSRGWPGAAVGTAEEGELVFVGSNSGTLWGLDVEDGDRVWEWTPEVEISANPLVACGSAGSVAAGSFYSAPVLVDNYLYMGAYDGKVYAVDTDSREEVWRFETDGPIVGDVVIADNTLFVGSADGRLYALDLAGLGNASENGTGDDGEPALKWPQPFETGDKVWTMPVVADGIVYFGSLDKKFYAVKADTGEPAWDEPFETDGGIAAEALVVDGVVYFGSFDDMFYALDASTGRPVWPAPFEANGWFWSAPVYRDGVVFTCCLDGNVYAIDADSGELRWSFDGGSPMKSSPVVIGNTLVVASEEGTVYGLDMDNGTPSWDFEVPDKVLASLAESDGDIYVYSNNNSVYCIDGSTHDEVWVEELP